MATKNTQLPVEWMTLDLFGVPCRVVISNERETSELEGNEGYFVSHDNTIYISENISDARKQDVLIHEILHFVCASLGARQILLPDFREPEWDTFEEKFILLLTPALYGLFKSQFGLSFPPIPKQVSKPTPGGTECLSGQKKTSRSTRASSARRRRSTRP